MKQLNLTIPKNKLEEDNLETKVKKLIDEKISPIYIYGNNPHIVRVQNDENIDFNGIEQLWVQRLWVETLLLNSGYFYSHEHVYNENKMMKTTAKVYKRT